MTSDWIPSKQFWEEEFPRLTKDRTAPALFKGVIPPSVVGVDHVLDGVRNLKLARRENLPSAARVRVYIGEERRDDMVAPVMEADDWHSNDSFVAWMQDVTGAERFSFIINNLEVTANGVAAGLGKLLQAAFAGWGVPIGGSEQAAFVGNYAGTAFGVHEGYEDAFLCHFGPGTKNFYCWGNANYIELTGTDEPAFGDYTWMLEHGELFPLEPGDVLFLPRRWYHVGVQSEFSVSVALPLYTYPLQRYARLAVMPELIEAQTPANDIISAPSKMYDVEFGVTDIASDLVEETRDLLRRLQHDLEGSIETIVIEKWAAMHSNGGWEVVPDDLAKIQAIAKCASAPLEIGDEVTLLAPYRITSVTQDVVYARGTRVDVTLPVEVISALNEHSTVIVSETMLAALQAVYETGALVVAGRDK